MTFDMNPMDDDPHGECRHEIDRLRAENQRLKLAALTADRESMGLEAENQRLGEERDSLASSLAIETCKYRDAWDENQRLREAIEEFASLVKESGGVWGLHRNGDDAPWADLLPGGRYETWLLNLGELAGLPEAAVESTGGEST